MRRDVLIGAVRKVLADLEASGMAEMLHQAYRNMRPGSKESDRNDWMDLEVLSNYLIITNSYSEIELEVLEKFELSLITKAKFWQAFGKSTEKQAIYSIYDSLRNMRQFLPKFIELIDREYSSEVEATDSILDSTHLLKVILTDEEGKLSSSERTVRLIRSVQDLYYVIQVLEGLEPSEIYIAGLDSGSEQQFDFFGIGSAVGDFKEVILGLYDRLAHRKNLRAKNDLENIAASLPVLEKIAEMEAAKKLSPDVAARLKLKTMKALEGFKETGAVIPEMFDARPANPMLVMRPEPKLLAAPAEIGSQVEEAHEPRENSSGSEPNDMSEEAEVSALSAKDVEALQALLAKARGQTELNDDSTDSAGQAKKTTSRNNSSASRKAQPKQSRKKKSDT